MVAASEMNARYAIFVLFIVWMIPAFTPPRMCFTSVDTILHSSSLDQYPVIETFCRVPSLFILTNVASRASQEDGRCCDMSTYFNSRIRVIHLRRQWTRSIVTRRSINSSSRFWNSIGDLALVPKNSVNDFRFVAIDKSTLISPGWERVCHSAAINESKQN